MVDAMGDRLKEYEARETSRRFLPYLPVYARLDGRSFSRFTKGMARPFDPNFKEVMDLVTIYLVNETNALIGYNQSDEISLLWEQSVYDSQIFFDGKIQKMNSILAALASTKFLQLAMAKWPEKIGDKPPVFDCRIFQLPNRTEAANTIYWRVKDATKNSISMAARSKFSHNAVNGLNSGQKQEKLWSEAGINWNDYPMGFKEGTFVRRVKKFRTLTDKELNCIPEKFRPTEPVERTTVEIVDMPRFGSITNKNEFLFEGAEPEITNG